MQASLANFCISIVALLLLQSLLEYTMFAKNMRTYHHHYTILILSIVYTHIAYLQHMMKLDRFKAQKRQH